MMVALRKESVDRNRTLALGGLGGVVALRKESVDRNMPTGLLSGGTGASLSARRAWIEILFPVPGLQQTHVALRKESVDRNVLQTHRAAHMKCRSPQGERG